jgi:DNA repair exonuclease SbcCD ATPase subunit
MGMANAEHGALSVQSGAQDLPESGNIDKIRDILFGAQSREFERRMSRLDDRLSKETAGLKEDLRKRFESLEIYVKGEVDALSERLRSEQSDRLASLKEVARDLKETGIGLERRLGQLDDQATRSQRDIRQQILEQSKSLSDEIRQKYELVSAALEQQVRELRTDKTDRNALADLFTELAIRLNNDFKLPGQD